MSLPIYTTPSSALGILLFKISSNFVRGIVSHCTFTWELFPVGCYYAGHLKFSYLAFTFAWTIIPTGHGLWYLAVDGHDPLPLSQGKFLDALTLWPWNFLAPCYEKIQASGGNGIDQHNRSSEPAGYIMASSVPGAWRLGRYTRLHMWNLLQGLQCTSQHGFCH